MITITSEINKLYAVTVYPVKRYRGGNGYFFTKGDKTITPSELPLKVRKELEPIAQKEWKK